MRLLLDTRVVLWWLGDEHLAGDAKTALGDARNHVFVSAAVEGLVLVTRDARLVTYGVDVLAAWKAGQTSRTRALRSRLSRPGLPTGSCALAPSDREAPRRSSAPRALGVRRRSGR